MPIYEYRCENCNCDFEYLKFKASDPEPLCPTCCKDNIQRLISAGSIRADGIPTGKGGFDPPKCSPAGGG